ncbi:hypothetical protein VCRA2119O48_110064 [Vibrio crassostreae]|nr:hypothetical protein VCRA2119O48_110064 [Vibrio crassostreae]CAK3904838.1 hypothetical protein VCRA212O16_330004 [Vibrio crassostreae]
MILINYYLIINIIDIFSLFSLDRFTLFNASFENSKIEGT